MALETESSGYYMGIARGGSFFGHQDNRTRDQLGVKNRAPIRFEEALLAYQRVVIIFRKIFIP